MRGNNLSDFKWVYFFRLWLFLLWACFLRRMLIHKIFRIDQRWSRGLDLYVAFLLYLDISLSSQLPWRGQLLMEINHPCLELILRRDTLVLSELIKIQWLHYLKGLWYIFVLNITSVEVTRKRCLYLRSAPVLLRDTILVGLRGSGHPWWRRYIFLLSYLLLIYILVSSFGRSLRSLTCCYVFCVEIFFDEIAFFFRIPGTVDGAPAADVVLVHYMVLFVILNLFTILKHIVHFSVCV